MEQKILLTGEFKQHIARTTQDGSEEVMGYLVGLPIQRTNELYITSCVACTGKGKNNFVSEIHHALLSIPGGLQLCGIFLKTNNAGISAITKKVHDLVVPIEEMEKVFNGGYYVLAVDIGSPLDSCLFRRTSQTFDKVETTIYTKDIFGSCVLFRLQAELPLTFEYSGYTESIEESIQSGFVRLENLVSSGCLQFHVTNSSAILEREDSNLFPLSIEDCCSDIFSIIDTNGIDSGQKKRHKTGDFSKDVVHMELVCQITGESAIQRTVPCSPIIHHEHKYFKEVSVALPLDVVLYLHSTECIRVLYHSLTEVVKRQIHCMCNYMLRNIKQLEDAHTPEAFHFLPEQLSHLITVIYPNGVAEELLTNTRKLLHKKLLLPKDRPCLKKLNSYLWPDEIQKRGGYLVNVHEGLNKSGVKDGMVTTVSGRYSYHHYMQDRINDDGWGCAYRSLQTLVSWFRYQGYTDKPVPSHKEIQQTLVDIGDKPEKIVGSKSWIGSVEVSMVLDKWIGVSSKILFVNNGADMSTKGRDLDVHFRTQGTPVMIGGGVLAHTILGVDFNEMTGEVKFLILDPHYTGGEDLKVIQDKGWCGWKGVDFWDKTAHYNMCMPQRPTLI